jgi:predicted metal-dependent hydrolase
MRPKPHRLSIIGPREITLADRKVEYVLKKSQRIRGIRLEIRVDSGLSVVVPPRYSQRHVDDTLLQKTAWILKRLPHRNPVQMPLFKKEIDHGEEITFMGKKLEVLISRAGKRAAAASLRGSTLSLSIGPGAPSRALALEKWYRQQAATIFKEKADHLQAMLGVRYRRITIRGQRKRWASASPLGNLSLNWKLLLAPEAIIDYVIMHELAHLKHMDHSKRFWTYLGKFCPRWPEYRKWLTVHEAELKEAATFAK